MSSTLTATLTVTLALTAGLRDEAVQLDLVLQHRRLELLHRHQLPPPRSPAALTAAPAAIEARRRVPPQHAPVHDGESPLADLYLRNEHGQARGVQ